MRRQPTAVALLIVLTSVLMLDLTSCKRCDDSKTVRSSSLRSPCCTAYQHSDSLPDQPPSGVIRIAIGGDSRDDSARVLPWAFQQAQKRGANAFVFLGDMEITRSADYHFKSQLKELGIPFYPVIGNHEVELLGLVRIFGGQHAVKEFKEDFLPASGIDPAPVNQVAYSADLGNSIHFIALDNVSQRHEGFGHDQLAWLERDLKAARAANKLILVGMHKGLAKSPVTIHTMEEDGANAIRDSDSALALFKRYN